MHCHFDILKYGILVEEDEINIAFKQCKKELVSALEEAAERVGNFHKKQLPKNYKIRKNNIEIGSVLFLIILDKTSLR